MLHFNTVNMRIPALPSSVNGLSQVQVLGFPLELSALSLSLPPSLSLCLSLRLPLMGDRRSLVVQAAVETAGEHNRLDSFSSCAL